MERFKSRNYIIQENGPVYLTKDMNKIVKWFEDILGWYSQIDERDTNGNGLYGCVFSLPPEIEVTQLAAFTGIHMFYGEPTKSLVSFMKIKGIDNLYKYVIQNGYDKITKPLLEPWGAKTMSIITPDENELRFFESVKI